MNNKNSRLNAFTDIIIFINNLTQPPHSKLQVNLDITKDFSYDLNFFFNSGKLLALLYLFNINNLSKSDISYHKGTFYIKNPFDKVQYNTLLKSDCINIAKNIISNSVYYKEFFPPEILYVSSKNYENIENGFKSQYTLLLKNKLSLIKLIKNYEMDAYLSQVINNLNMLNYNDLNRQLTLLQIRFKKNINGIANNPDLTSNVYSIADSLIENSIIGIYKNEIEITWIRYSKKQIKPLNQNNIYISFFFAYLSKEEDNKYYLQLALQALPPAVRYFSVNVNKQPRAYNDFIYIIYFLNSITNSSVIKDFITANNINLSKNDNMVYDYNFEDNLFTSSIKWINKLVLPGNNVVSWTHNL